MNQMTGTARAGAQGTAVNAAPSGATAPDDPQRLREQIGSTREQLGATVEQLAARADVKARARAKAAQLTGRAKSAAAPIRQATPGLVRKAAPDAVRNAATRGAGAVRDRRMVALTVSAGVLAAVSLALWRWGKR